MWWFEVKAWWWHEAYMIWLGVGSDWVWFIPISNILLILFCYWWLELGYGWAWLGSVLCMCWHLEDMFRACDEHVFGTELRGKREPRIMLSVSTELVNTDCLQKRPYSNSILMHLGSTLGSHASHMREHACGQLMVIGALWLAISIPRLASCSSYGVNTIVSWRWENMQHLCLS